MLAVDLDGTILDARARQVAVARWAVAPSALDADAFWAAKRRGATTRGALEQLGWAPDEAAAAAQRWAAAIEEPRWRTLDEPLPGAAVALGAARAAGRRIVVLTARRDRRGARETIDRTGTTDAADRLLVVAPADAAGQKAAALQRLQATAMIGDTESDAEAADRAGVRFVAVASGQRDADYLRAHGADTVVADLAAAVADILGR